VHAMGKRSASWWRNQLSSAGAVRLRSGTFRPGQWRLGMSRILVSLTTHHSPQSVPRHARGRSRRVVLGWAQETHDQPTGRHHHQVATSIHTDEQRKGEYNMNVRPRKALASWRSLSLCGCCFSQVNLDLLLYFECLLCTRYKRPVSTADGSSKRLHKPPLYTGQGV